MHHHRAERRTDDQFSARDSLTSSRQLLPLVLAFGLLLLVALLIQARVATNDVFWHVVMVVIVEAVLIAALYLNIARRRAANRALRASLDEKETLLREVHHRVKNNLQVISSLLTLQTAHVKTPEQALAALADSERRVLSMSLVHEMLYGSASLSRIPAGAYLETLGRQIIENHRGPGSEVDFFCHADRSIELDVDTAMPMGLIVSELVSNSAKHGRSADARLRVSLSLIRKGPTLELRVRDEGPGFCFDRVATTRTLGLSLVETLTRQLDAELRYHNHDGSTFQIVVPHADRGAGASLAPGSSGANVDKPSSPAQ